MEISKKRNAWKKTLVVAMAAAMIPSVVSPISVEASSADSITNKSAVQSKSSFLVYVSAGRNLHLTLDGEKRNDLLKEKDLIMVNTKNPNEVYRKAADGGYWVDPGKTYSIYDVTNGEEKVLKGQIRVDKKGNSTVATLAYTTPKETEVETTKPSEKSYSVYIKPGYNIELKLDGKLRNDLLKERDLMLVNTKNPDEVYYKSENGVYWLKTGKTYDIYDVTNGEEKVLKGQIRIDNKGFTTVPTLNYKTVSNTDTVKAADLGVLRDTSSAYYEYNANGERMWNIGLAGVIQNSDENKVVAHAPASIQYNLKGQNFERFTGEVSLDATRKSGKIKVEVLVDDKVVFEAYQEPTSEATPFNIPLDSKSEKLEVKVTGVSPSGNPNQNANMVLTNGEFHKVEKTMK